MSSLSPDSQPRSPNLDVTTPDTSSTSNVVMPSIAPLRIDSELVVFWAMVDAFGGPEDLLNREFKCKDALKPGTSEFYNTLQFTDLISRGNNENLLCDENKFRLARLGATILSESTDPRRREFAKDLRLYLDFVEHMQSSETPEETALDDWWIDPDNLAMWPPQVKKTEMSLRKELDLRFFDISKAHQKGPWIGAMIGLLALRIESHGFGAQEEEATRMLGGSPEHFRACVEQNQTQYLEGSGTPSALHRANAEQFRETLAVALKEGYNFSRYDFSSCFDGMTTAEIEKALSDVPEEIRSRIITQVEARHARMMQGPAATGERRILSGTAVWASNLTEHLGRLKHLNHLDLSNLSLEGADLSEKKMAGCRFDGSSLRGAKFIYTDLQNTRFGAADLTDADVRLSDLRGADLSEANLSGLGSQFFNQSQFEVFEPLADAQNNPLYDRTTRFLSKSWDNPFRHLTPEEKELQRKRFERWTPEQVEAIASKVDFWQKQGLKRVAQLLREDAKNNLILPPRNPVSSAHEFLPPTVIGDSNAQEIETALSRHQSYVHSAGLPVLKGNHNGKDLTHHDLRGGFVVGASLVNALMPNQDLEGICINNANLSGINLSGANLTDAILVNVDLSGADLRGVDLTRTKFVNCNLDRVLLDGVTMRDTQMQQCTVSNITIGEGVIDDLLVCQTILERELSPI